MAREAGQSVDRIDCCGVCGHQKQDDLPPREKGTMQVEARTGRLRSIEPAEHTGSSLESLDPALQIPLGQSNQPQAD